MESIDVTITEIIEDHFSIDKETAWLKCKTDSNALICFWGDLHGPKRNIVSIRNQSLPVIISISSPEDCEPSLREKSKYKLSRSVPSNVFITINPEF